MGNFKMSMNNNNMGGARQAIDQVRRRRKLARIGRLSYKFWCAMAAVLGVVVIVSKMTGWVSEYMSWWWVVSAGVLAVVCGAVFYKRVDERSSARRIDEHWGRRICF